LCSSRLLFTGAPEQDGAKKERHDKWHSWDSDNKTGTGVPWRREGSRVRILDPSDQEEQQCDPIHDHECATCPAPQPLDSAEGSPGRPEEEQRAQMVLPGVSPPGRAIADSTHRL